LKVLSFNRGFYGLRKKYSICIFCFHFKLQKYFLVFALFYYFQLLTCVEKIKTDNKVKKVCCLQTKHAIELQKLQTLWSLWIVIVKNCKWIWLTCNWAAVVAEIFETLTLQSQYWSHNNSCGSQFKTQKWTPYSKCIGGH